MTAAAQEGAAGDSPAPARRPRRAPHTVSVIVPTLNAAAALPEQLDALRQQDYEGRWELLIADNGSTDSTVEVARRHLAVFPAARIVDAGDRIGASHARNVGASHARGDFLAFTDADDLVSGSWLRALAAAAPSADLVAGEVDIERLSDPVVRSWHVLPPRQRALQSLRFLSYASGTCTGIWRAVFQRLGGFDEDTLVGEDIELSWRAQLSGYRLALAQDAIVHVRLRRSPCASLRQHYRYGAARPHLYRRFRSSGMPAGSGRATTRTWIWLALAFPASQWSARVRGRWCVEAGLATGKIAGSIRNRVLFV